MSARKRKIVYLPLNGRQVKRISRLTLLGVLLILIICFIFQIQKESSRRIHDISFQVEWSNPEVKNNIDLVKYAQNALKCRWGYVYGTYGQVLEPELLDTCEKRYSDQVTPYLDFTKINWMDGRVTDCVGLIKGYGWFDPQSGEIRYRTNGMPDLNANGMVQAAAEKGSIDTIPEIPGLAVWMDGHIGVYIGNGEVIEAMSSKKGVVKTKLKGRGWNSWLKVPSIQYP